LPIALCEAALLGRPAIVTDVAGNGEVTQDGRTGFLASAAAAGPIDDALDRAWHARETWPTLGLAAREVALSFLTPEPVAAFCDAIVDTRDEARP
jgi:glycosyltransferase involved in cell wall biosynthesis